MPSSKNLVVRTGMALVRADVVDFNVHMPDVVLIYNHPVSCMIQIAHWLAALTDNNRDWGFGWNHKRVYRIYRELELNLRIKLRKRFVRETPEELAVPDAVNRVWSMDFRHDQLEERQKLSTARRSR